MRPTRLLALVTCCLLPSSLLAAVPGGTDPEDCWLELDAPAPNYPISLPGKPKRAKEVRCFDGDAGCDLDGAVNGECRFPLDVCLRVNDPSVPACTPTDVVSFAVDGAPRDPDLAALQAAGQALLPATATACTTGQSVRVSLRSSKHGFGPARRTIKLKAGTSAGTDSDRVAFTCLNRDWPVENYDHANHRATPVESILSASNASQLGVRWSFDGPAVSSTPTVANGMVFVTSWDGHVYALRQRDGKLRWSYSVGDTTLGLQGSATVTPEGRVLVGDSDGIVHCLVAKTGELLWKATVGDTDPDHSHIWGSPVAASGRVFVGRAS